MFDKKNYKPRNHKGISEDIFKKPKQAPPRKLSKYNINNNQTLTIDGKHQPLHPTKTPLQKQGKSPSQTNSFTDNQKTNKDGGINKPEVQNSPIKEETFNNMNKIIDTNNIKQQITEQSHVFCLPLLPDTSKKCKWGLCSN